MTDRLDQLRRQITPRMIRVAALEAEAEKRQANVIEPHVGCPSCARLWAELGEARRRIKELENAKTEIA